MLRKSRSFSSVFCYRAIYIVLDLQVLVIKKLLFVRSFSHILYLILRFCEYRFALVRSASHRIVRFRSYLYLVSTELEKSPAFTVALPGINGSL